MAGGAVRVGFWGAGLIARFHATSLRRSDEDVVIATVHDPDSDRAAAFAGATGATAVATEAEVLQGVDAVYVCTWTSEHPRLVALAAAAGVAVFCEKPLAVDLPTARELVAAVAAAGVVNQVGLVLRRSPAFVLARRLVQDPAAGPLQAVVFRDDQYLPVQGMYASDWRADPRRAGAGTLLEHSIHDVDLLEWMGGPVSDVTCRTASFHDLEGIEDTAAAQLAFAGGALGSLVSVWHDVLARPSLRRVELFCQRRHVVVEGDWWGPVRWSDPDGSGEILEGDSLAAKADAPDGGNADAAFVRAVRTGEPADPDVRVAVRAHELVDACYRSAATGGSPVDVAPAEAHR